MQGGGDGVGMSNGEEGGKTINKKEMFDIPLLHWSELSGTCIVSSRTQKHITNPASVNRLIQFDFFSSSPK